MVLAGLGGGEAGRVVPELGQHPGTQDRAEAGLAQHDLSVRVLARRRLQLPFERSCLPDRPGQDGDVGVHGRPERLGDQGGLFELRRVQRGADLLGAGVEVALPPGAAQRRGDLGTGESAARGRRGGQCQHGQRVALMDQSSSALELVGTSSHQSSCPSSSRRAARSDVGARTSDLRVTVLDPPTARTPRSREGPRDADPSASGCRATRRSGNGWRRPSDSGA